MVKTKRETILSKNPATGEILGEVPVMDSQEVQAVVENSKKAQIQWARTSLAERAEVLRALQKEILSRKDSLCKLIADEVGKPPIEALTGEIFTILESLDYAISQGPKLLAPQKVSHRLLKTFDTQIHYHPHGVVGIIGPWNYPFLTTFSPAVAALIAGNGVVMKPSEFTPLVILEIPKMCQAAGFPEGLVGVVPGYGATGEALIRSGVNKISFTGSGPTGRKVAALCGELLIPVALELGGKDPMIVLEDAPLERAVRGALWGGFCNSGQICASVERIYVEEGIYDHFVHALQDEIATLRQGQEDLYETEVGAMTNENQYQIVDRQVKDALEKGAKALTGGEGKAPFYPPTLLVDVTPEMDICQQETFGPVLNVFKVKNIQSAIEKANEGPYGLSASVWTADVDQAEKIASQLDCGFVYINDHLGPSGAGESAWGGCKESGFGKSRGAEGLMAMVKSQYISRDITGSPQAAYWYPYTREKYDRFSEVLDQLYGGSLFSRLIGLLKLTWLTFRG